MKKILLTIVTLLCIVGGQANAKVVDGEKMLFPPYWRNETTGNWDPTIISLIIPPRTQGLTL